jgi:hypothetical protein
MKGVLAVTAAAMFGVAVLSAPATAAAATVCYKVAVLVNDDAVVDEEGCQSVG